MSRTRTVLAAAGALALALSLGACSSGPSEEFQAALPELQESYDDARSGEPRLDNAQGLKRANPDWDVMENDVEWHTELCHSLRNGYNEEAAVFDAKDFEDSGLPSQIDPADPEFDCVID
jgi:hypothetical protein